MRALPGAFWASAAAIPYSLLLAGFAVLLPVYATAGSDGTTGTATLLDENPEILAFLAVPPVAAVIVFGLLHRVCHRGSRLARAGAWMVTGLTWPLALAGALSIGIFIAPLAGLFTYACARVR
jgi:hypothetical protein